MFRVSIILKNAREDKCLDYGEISKKLKIPAKYLEALETEKMSDFPQEPYCSLIVKDYATFLGLNGNDILTLYRRDFDRRTKSSPQNKIQLNFTPQFTFKVGLILVIITFVFYLTYEYIKFNQPPRLEVNWPESSRGVGKVDIIGKTDAEATVKINQDLVIVDSQGNFKKTVEISSPSSKIVIESKSNSGKISTTEKLLNF